MANYPQVSLSATLTDATGLQIKAWDRILQMRALPEDILFTINGIYNAELRAIPDAIFMKMPGEASSGARSVTFPLLMPLSTDALYGTGVDPITSAEQQSVRQLVAYYNDYVKSVASYLYGIEFKDGEPYGLLEKITPQLGTFVKELMGYWVRYTFLNKYSPNCLATPVSLSAVPHPNTLCKGVALAQQPAERWSTTAATFNSIIATQMNAIPSGTSGALTASFIKAAQTYFAYTKYVLPVSIPWARGEQGYILTVPSDQVDYLLNPANTDGLGTTWAAVSRYQAEDRAQWPQVLGKVDRTWLVQDPRAATASVYGTASGSNVNSATNAIYVDNYLRPGLNDARGSDTFEACMFLGRGAFADMEPEAVHYETERQMVKKFQIKAAAGSRGFTRVDYDKSTATSTSIVNQSSGVLWVRKQTASFT